MNMPPPASKTREVGVPTDLGNPPPKQDSHRHYRLRRAFKGIAIKLRNALDKVLPPYRTYFGRSRTTVLIVISILILVVLVLIIGLAAGLTHRSRGQDLPLPSNTQTFTGDLTYYSPGLGACGVTSSNTDDICSISHFLFDAESKGSDPNANPLCGLKIRATRFDEQVNSQRSVDLTVVDRCVGCAPTDLDLSPGAFSQLANPALGRVTVTWAWLSPTPSF
ncbi:hypothetical protein MMC20_003003 [Loxospora ochrophaea]|nr:hypothetical protein [Loxospora ochrophaea]